MKIGDLVKCIEGAVSYVDGGTGIVIEVEDYSNPFDRLGDGLSVRVQWAEDDLWYHGKDLEVVSESR